MHNLETHQKPVATAYLNEATKKPKTNPEETSIAFQGSDDVCVWYTRS